MEVVEYFMTVVQSMGFPIACVIALFYFLAKEREQHRADLGKEREEHKKEIDRMIEAVENNTRVLEKLELVICRDSKP